MNGRAFYPAVVFLCVAVCAREAHAACPADNYESCGTGCFQACDCSFEKVSGAITDAPAGSTINVPAGECTWSGNLVIAKGINLVGAGTGSTIITSAIDSGYLILYDPSDLDANDPLRLSGFSFDMQDTSLFDLGHGGMDAPFTVQTKIRIDHNRFYNAPDSDHQAIWNHSGLFGVVDSNQFDDVAYPIRSDAGVGDSSFWDNFTFTLGAADNNLYFEDNTFTGVSAGIVSDCQYSGRYAFRYNTIHTGVDSYPLFDMHGNQYSTTPGASMWSCFGGELYGNQIEAGSHVANLLDQRGGKAVVFYNSIVSTSSDSMPGFIKTREEYDDALCPTTSAQPQHASDSYYWNNRVNSDLVEAVNDLEASGTHDGPDDSSTLSDSTAGFPYTDSYVGLYLHNETDGSKCRITSNTETTADCALDGGSENDWDAGDGYTIENDCCRAIAMNSEYYADNTDFATDPTYGVGCGTLASRPASCTPRVGYWATDQICTDLAGMVGANPSTPISGTLYVCTAADTWTEYYTPIPYPHPLRRQPCTALGGSCCAAGQECQGGRFDPSSDCASLCCVGGTCAAAPDPIADGPADGEDNDGLDAATDFDAGDGGEQEGGGNGGCGCIMAG